MSLNGIIKFITYKPISYAIIFIIMIIVILSLLIYKGFSVTTIGFIITPTLTIFFIIIWDGYNSKKKEETIFLNLKLEFASNLISLLRNSEKILNEFKCSKDNKHMVIPLNSLNVQIWDLLRFNTPNKLFKKNLLGDISGFYFLINELNETIMSRENFRINNGSMDNFGSGLLIYDKIIFNLIQNVILSFERLINIDELRGELADITPLKTHLERLKLQNNKIIEFFDKNKDS